jgi:hypothetical protein
LPQEALLNNNGLNETSPLKDNSIDARVSVPTSVSPSPACTCLVCLGLGTESPNHFATAELTHLCRFAGCGWFPYHYFKSAPYWDANPKRKSDEFKHHERRHCAKLRDSYMYGKKINRAGPIRHGEMDYFFCAHPNCTFTTRRWSDLERHTASKHCTAPKPFPCSALDCKYHGEGKGFSRKDKLQSHFQTVHEGKARPGKANRVIKPKASGKPAVKPNANTA